LIDWLEKKKSLPYFDDYGEEGVVVLMTFFLVVGIGRGLAKFVKINGLFDAVNVK